MKLTVDMLEQPEDIESWRWAHILDQIGDEVLSTTVFGRARLKRGGSRRVRLKTENRVIWSRLVALLQEGLPDEYDPGDASGQ